MAVPKNQTKNGKKRFNKRSRPRRGMRSNATQVLAQGVGSVPRKAFGAERVGGTLACWDAKLLHHLALPRAVGPYTVVRTTRRFQTDARDVLIGTFRRMTGTGPGSAQWTDICAMYDIDGALPINASSGNGYTVRTPLDFLEVGSSMATCVPSALSVQILNPGALQTTSGIIYAGVMNTQAHINNRDESWDDFLARYVQYQSPRLMSAAKLSLRGVQINSYPLSMNQVSEFTPLVKSTDGAKVIDTNAPSPVGWAPIMINNPQSANLEYLVTTEWRVRFDLANPASASHTHHPVASDSTWDKLCRQASMLGHGVRDIAELVANGAEAYNAVRGARAALAIASA